MQFSTDYSFSWFSINHPVLLSPLSFQSIQLQTLHCKIGKIVSSKFLNVYFQLIFHRNIFFIEYPVINCSGFQSKSPLRSDLNYSEPASYQTWTKKGLHSSILVIINFSLLIINYLCNLRTISFLISFFKK